MPKQVMLITGGMAAAAIAVLLVLLWPANQYDHEAGHTTTSQDGAPTPETFPDAGASSARTLNATHRPEQANDERLVEALAGIGKRLTALANNQERMQRELDRLAQRQAEDTDVQDDQGIESTDTAEAAAEAYALKTEETLEQQFIREGVDTQWAGEMMNTLQDGFLKEELAGIDLVDSACGSTICQVNLHFDADTSVEDGMQRLMHHRPWDGPTFFSVNADGLARIYFARDGFELPAPAVEADSF